MSGLHKLLGALLVVLCFGAAAQDVVRVRAEWATLAPLAPGEDVPAFRVRVLDGPFATRESLDGQPTLLVFWATWCGVCSSQMPMLNELAEAGSSGGFRVVGVNTDRDADQAALAKAYVDERKLGFETWLDGGSLSRIFRASLLPHYVVLDASGRIRHVHEGRTSRATLEGELQALVDDAGAAR
jgi:thiol-disulfide isomerase/thioredoxin